MSTVYVLTEGSYSDYTIIAVYSTREHAERVAKLLGYDVEIEEYPLDVIPQEGESYSVWVDVETGDVLRTKAARGMDWQDDSATSLVCPRPSVCDTHWQGKGRQGIVYATSYRGEAVAIKAARDFRVQALAQREGVG